MKDKDRIEFRREPGRLPSHDAQHLRKQLLKFVSREIARRQKVGEPLGGRSRVPDYENGPDRLDILEVELQNWRLHQDFGQKNPSHSLRLEMEEFAPVEAELKEIRRQKRLVRRKTKGGSRGNPPSLKLRTDKSNAKN